MYRTQQEFEQSCPISFPSTPIYYSTADPIVPNFKNFKIIFETSANKIPILLVLYTNQILVSFIRMNMNTSSWRNDLQSCLATLITSEFDPHYVIVPRVKYDY